MYSTIILDVGRFVDLMGAGVTRDPSPCHTRCAIIKDKSEKGPVTALVELEGTVESVVFESDDGRFSVFKIRTRQGFVSAVMRTRCPRIGEHASLVGEWVEHPRFGQQLQVNSCQIAPPSSRSGIERFLGSGAVKGVGPSLATRIVQVFGEETLDILKEAPYRLREVSGIGAKKAQQIAASYAELAEWRDLMLWLEMHGISGHYAARLYARYGAASLTMLQQEPYKLADDIDGIGFRTADRLAILLGVDRHDEARLAAGIRYALGQASLSGHTCIPEAALVTEAAKILGADRAEVARCLVSLDAQGQLTTEDYRGEKLIYPEWLYRAEVEAAKRFKALKLQAKPLPKLNVAAWLEDWSARENVTWAEEQRAAVLASWEHGLLVLTGGPGTGKTTVIRAILDLLESSRCRVVLAAPTGRAAKRLAESSGRLAQTVHRLLEYQPGDGYGAFAKHEGDTIDADAVIVDEASMLDIQLTYHLLRAIAPGTRLILVGDVDQLPAVGPGNVLQDLIRCGELPVIRLTTVFRQGGRSEIVTNAHRINRGMLPTFNAPGEFDFVACPDETEAAQRIVQFCREEMLAAGDDAWQNVQVLSPMHKLACGVQNLNRLLQEALNPPAPDKEEQPTPYGLLRVGDKVMQIRNNYEKEVYNGDVGRITAIRPKQVVVSYPEGGFWREVGYLPGELDELQLAYAMSVHKSQGSEYPIVLLALVRGHFPLLVRNLLYTAVTRAKQRVILFGDKAALETAVDNDRVRRRYSLLAERLVDESFFA